MAARKKPVTMEGRSPTENMLTLPELFGLASATPLQRAICRASDGFALGELWDDANVRAAFGGARPPTGQPPRMFLNICAIRTGKSLWASACAVTRALTADLTRVRAGEAIARIPILSTVRDNASIVFSHLVGHVSNSPQLSKLLVSDTADSITLRRPTDGKHVEIRVTAGARGGSSLVGRWLAGVIFDEATLMTGSADGTVRDLGADLLQLEGRMLPAAQVVLIGSTMAPPRGPAYDLLIEHFGHPNQDAVAVWSTGPEMRPTYYTEDVLRTLSSEARLVCERRVFLDPETSFLSTRSIDACVRKEPERLGRVAGHNYVATSDPATRKNAWTLVVLGVYDEEPTVRVVVAREWRPAPGERLSPAVVMAEMAEICREYGCVEIWGDQHHGDSLSELALQNGLDWIPETATPQEERDGYLELERLITMRDIELAPVPQLRRDLQLIRRRVAQNGSLAFVLPVTGDGRHCDYAPALVKGLRHLPGPPLGVVDTREAPDQALVDRMLAGPKTAGVMGALERIAT